MNTLTIKVTNDTDFDKIKVGARIRKFSFAWGNDVQEWEKSHLLFKLKNFLFNILQRSRNLTVLDLSLLDGLKDVSFPATYLHEIYFPYSIEAVYLNKCKALRKVSARGATSIEIRQAPVLECVEFETNLKELSLTETGIAHLDLPQNINLGTCAFKGCKNLESVILRSGTDVPPSTFEDCSNLYEVTLPDDLLVIEPYVFRGCTNLKYVHGGKNVKQLFPSAFEGCYNIEMMECKDFYRFTDLNISDKQWLAKYRPFSTLIDRKKQIKKFVNGLKEQNIEKPEEYIAENFFHKIENHFGFVAKHLPIHSWMIWSLSHSRFIATRGDKYYLQTDDLVTFSIERKPTIVIEDNLYFQYPMMYIDDASSLMKIEHDSEHPDEYEIFLEFFKPRVSLLDHYLKITKTIDTLDIRKIIDSYSIKARTWWVSRPGRDDHQHYERIAKSDYTDEYLNTLLPQENYKNYESGGSSWNFDEEEETRKMQESADAKAKELKEYAHRKYTKEAHICKLMEVFINERRKLEFDIERNYHVHDIKEFMRYKTVYSYSGEGENSLIELYGYTLEDILAQVTRYLKFWKSLKS